MQVQLSCPLCGEAPTETVLQRDAITIGRCVSCGIQRVVTPVDTAAIARLYDAEYYQSEHSQSLGYDDYAADRANIERTCRRRLDLIARHSVAEGRLLDVGCAMGFFIKAAREQGWHAEGLEISPFCAETVRRELGIEVHHGTLSEADLPEASFDLVTMFDVIEHLVDPMGELVAAARVLKPGGILAITTPAADSLPARLMRVRWIGYAKLDEHLWYFTARTLAEILRRTGFEPIWRRTAGKHVSLGFFAKRVGFYSRALGWLLGQLFRVTGLAKRPVYADPKDMMLVLARRNPTPDGADDSP